VISKYLFYLTGERLLRSSRIYRYRFHAQERLTISIDNFTCLWAELYVLSTSSTLIICCAQLALATQQRSAVFPNAPTYIAQKAHSIFLRSCCRYFGGFIALRCRRSWHSCSNQSWKHWRSSRNQRLHWRGSSLNLYVPYINTLFLQNASFYAWLCLVALVYTFLRVFVGMFLSSKIICLYSCLVHQHFLVGTFNLRRIYTDQFFGATWRCSKF